MGGGQPLRKLASKKDKQSSCIQECQDEASHSGDVDSSDEASDTQDCQTSESRVSGDNSNQ